jgi:protein TonB
VALAHDDPDRGRSSGRPVARLSLAPTVRTEPALDIPPSALAEWHLEPAKILYLRDADRRLDGAPSAPLGSAYAPAQPLTRRRTNAAIVASVLLHLSIALAFVQLPGDEVQIAGGEVPQVALLGNAPEDASAAGDSLDQPDPEITSVTILTMLDAQPVTTAEVTLSPVELEQPLEVEAAIEQVSPDEVETVAPVENVAAVPVTAEPAPVAKVAEVAPVVPSMAETADATEPVEPLPAPASLAPEVLTAERVEPSDMVDVAPVPSESLAEPVDTVREVQQAPPERPVPTIEPVTPTVQPVEEKAVVQRSENAAVVAPVEDPKPPVKDPPLTRKPTPPKPKSKPALEKPVPPKAKPTETTRGPRTDERKQKPAGKPVAKSGSKGRAEADAKRGQADGALNGRSTATGKGAKNQAAGNAAVTNYPGKIVSKLRRALRYPAQAKSQNLRGEVQVSFTVSSGGAVGGVRVVRSSGSPILDRAAIETVRRAAPFPPIPEGAGRSSWPFTVPLAFTR